MIRINPKDLFKIFISLLSHRLNYGSLLFRDNDWVYKNLYKSPAPGYSVPKNIRTTLQYIYGNTRIEDGDGAESEALEARIANMITGYYTTTRGEAGEGDLIDQVISLVQVTNGKNVLGGQTLNNLRAALLLPNERAKFAAQAAKREGCCGRCGKKMVSGEIATFHNDGYGPYMACIVCIKPQFQPCSKCGEIIEVDRGITRALGKMNACPKHGPGEADKRAAEKDLDQPKPFPGLTRNSLLDLENDTRLPSHYRASTAAQESLARNARAAARSLRDTIGPSTGRVSVTSTVSEGNPFTVQPVPWDPPFPTFHPQGEMGGEFTVVDGPAGVAPAVTINAGGVDAD